MSTQIFVSFTRAELEQLQGVALQHVAKCAAEYEKAKSRSIPGEEETATETFMRSTTILAEIGAGLADAPGAVPAQGTGHTQAERQGMIDAGLDPDKELGPMDPRAFSPVCAHGRRFTEPCDLCAASDTCDHGKKMSEPCEQCQRIALTGTPGA